MMTATFPYTLAAIDIDDTLVGPDKKIGLANRRAVARLRSLGCRVVLASGRRHANMLPYCNELGLDDFVVSSQGARVEHASNGERIHHATLPSPLGASLVAEGLARGFTVMFWGEAGIFAQAQTSWIDLYQRETGGDPVTIANLSTLIRRYAEKIVWATDPAQVAAAAAELAPQLADRLTMTVTENHYLEFSACGANKGTAVAALARHLAADQGEVLAFGDGHNDVPLLQWAGCGVAMPHGRAAARSAAQLVASDGNPESALARAVDMLTAGFASPSRSF